MELIIGMQSRRMDEQRASLPTLPGLTNQKVLSNFPKPSKDDTSLPDDNFFDMLMRCQVKNAFAFYLISRCIVTILRLKWSLARSYPIIFWGRLQGSRLEDQRSALPTDGATPMPPAAPTVPDDDFFALILRFQSSGRLEDQRSSLPRDAPRDIAFPLNANDKANESTPAPPPPLPSGAAASIYTATSTANSSSSSSSTSLVSRLVKGKK